MTKTLTFSEIKNITSPSKHAFEYRLYFSLVDNDKIGKPEEEFETQEIEIDVEISETKAAIWNLNSPRTEIDLIKVLFEYGKRELIEKIKDSTVENNNSLRIYTNTHTEPECPFNPDKIVINKGDKYEITIPDETLVQRLEVNVIASSIITKRDEINALFKNKFNDKLFLINQERNLLELFRSADSIEEFSYRITSLGNLVGSLNKNMLSKESRLISEDYGSIHMLEVLLKNFSTDQTVTSIFKNLNKIRQGYPVHGDNVEGVVDSHKYFGLSYPLTNFKDSWELLLSKYNDALFELFSITESFET